MLYRRPKSKVTCSSTSGLIASCLIYSLLGSSVPESMMLNNYSASKLLLFAWPVFIFWALIGVKYIYPRIQRQCKCCFGGLRMLLCLVLLLDVVIAHGGMFILLSAENESTKVIELKYMSYKMSKKTQLCTYFGLVAVFGISQGLLFKHMG